MSLTRQAKVAPSPINIFKLNPPCACLLPSSCTASGRSQLNTVLAPPFFSPGDYLIRASLLIFIYGCRHNVRTETPPYIARPPFANRLRNSTFVLPLMGAQDTYWGSFEEISKYNVSLNYAEKLWLAWYTYMQNDILATGIMSFVMHETVYFGRSLPWIIIDAIPWFRRYKIQDVCFQLQYPMQQYRNLTLYSKKSPPPGNSGNALSSSSSPTSPSSSRRSGCSIPCAATSA